MCVCARARSLTRFFSLCRSNTLQNCSAALRIFSFYERKDSEKHGTFWPDQKRKTPNPAFTSAKEGKHVGRRVCGVEKEEEEKQEG